MTTRKDPLPPEPATSQREYGHSSGDRNTKDNEADWPELEGGTQRNATPTVDDPEAARDVDDNPTRQPG